MSHAFTDDSLYFVYKRGLIFALRWRQMDLFGRKPRPKTRWLTEPVRRAGSATPHAHVLERPGRTCTTPASTKSWTKLLMQQMWVLSYSFWPGFPGSGGINEFHLTFLSKVTVNIDKRTESLCKVTLTWLYKVLGHILPPSVSSLSPHSSEKIWQSYHSVPS